MADDDLMADIPPSPGVGRPNPNAGAQEALEVRAARALELRLSGANYSQIGKALGCDKSTAWDAVQRALRVDRERTQELRDEYRNLQLNRIERMVSAYWMPAVRGRMEKVAVTDPETGTTVYEERRVLDHVAGDKLIKLFDRQARLLGLDAPIKIAVSDDTKATLDRLMEDLDAMLLNVIDVDSVDVGDLPELDPPE
jgi:hypothetical protein